MNGDALPSPVLSGEPWSVDKIARAAQALNRRAWLVRRRAEVASDRISIMALADLATRLSFEDEARDALQGRLLAAVDAEVAALDEALVEMGVTDPGAPTKRPIEPMADPAPVVAEPFADPAPMDHPV